MSIIDYLKKIKFIHNQKQKKVKNRFVAQGCSIKFSASDDLKKAETEEKLLKLIKKYANNPEKLINYMQLNALSVYKIKNAENFLLQINEEEGFITPLKGIKALYLNIILKLFAKSDIITLFKTKPVFIFEKGETEIYTIARALYKYYGFKNKLKGYDTKSQEIFKRVYRSKSAENLNINDLYACKEALARDMESIKFAMKTATEIIGAKKALNKIKTTSSAVL